MTMMILRIVEKKMRLSKMLLLRN